MSRDLTPEFQRLVDGARKSWFEMNKAQAPQGPLYHYTDGRGLVGIVETQKLWATDARYLNDASELAYGCSLVEGVLRERWAIRRVAWTGQGEEPGRMFLEQALTDQLFNPYEPSQFAFVTCFCERDDLLTQWRAYADRGAGYSIGFSFGGLFWNPRSAMDQRLNKVIYDQEVQLTLIRELVDGICDTLESVAAPDKVNVVEKSALITDALRALRIVLMDYLPCFKHPSFEAEQEWRVVQNCDAYEEYPVLQTYDGYKGPNLGRIKFRPAAVTIAPYVELEIESPVPPYWGKLPIVSVRHGPTQHPELAKASLRVLLEKQKYEVVVLGHEAGAVEILGSNVPLRV